MGFVSLFVTLWLAASSLVLRRHCRRLETTRRFERPVGNSELIVAYYDQENRILTWNMIYRGTATAAVVALFLTLKWFAVYPQ